MKKNLSINIGGIIFHIEEDGYAQLKAYLESINTYFATFDESKEIIADIEGRIAEIFLSKLEEGKQVITLGDVQELITTMGTTKDFDASIESEDVKATPEESVMHQEASGDSKKEQHSERTSKPKRLYRDTHRKVVGGVASGVAHYFKIDPIWVRIVFLALLFPFFFEEVSVGIFIGYLVLWIAIPGNRDLEENEEVKKLFRNTEDRVLGGISSGIAAYFGGDPVVVRILFVLSFFLGGAGFLAYIILWIIVPEARTLTEKMQMQGEPVTLENIESVLRKNLNVKEGEENALVKIIFFPFRLAAMVFQSLGKILSPFLRFLMEAVRVVAGVLLAFLGFVLMLSFTISLVVLAGLGGSMEAWVHFGDFPVQEVFATVTPTLFILLFIVVLIPALALSLIGLSISLKKRVAKANLSWTLFGLWVASAIGVAFMIPQVVQNFQTEGTHKESIVFERQNSVPVLRINDLEKETTNSLVALSIRGQEDSTQYELVIKYESRGATTREAQEYASMASYAVVRSKDDFVFDTDFSYGDAPFRFQEANATLYIPHGQVFKMEYDLEKILRNTLWMYDYDISDLNEKNEWMFDNEGKLICLNCADNSKSDAPTEEEGEKANKTYDFDDFDEIRVNSFINFDIQESEHYSVELQGSSDYIKDLNVSQDGSSLEITYKKDVKWNWWDMDDVNKDITVYITMPELEKIELSGACEGYIEGFKTTDISIEMSGASKLDAEIYPYALDIELTGASTAVLKGKAKEMNADMSGASSLKAYDFTVDYIKVDASGASTAKVMGLKDLDVTASGASTVKYDGAARIQKNESGMSSIEER